MMKNLSVMLNYAYYPIVGTALYGIYSIANRVYAWYTSPLRKIPGPPLASFLFGYVLVVLREPFMDPQKRWWNDYRKKHDGKSPPLLVYNYFFGSYSLLVLDPEIVKMVLMESASREPVSFIKKYSFLKALIGNGLVTLEGTEWSRHRRLIQPSFQNINFLKTALNKSVIERTERLIDAWRLVSSKETHIIDVASHMSAVTLDVIGDVAFSHDFGATKVFGSWARDQLDDTKETKNNALEGTVDPFIQSMQASMKLSFITLTLSLSNMSWLEKYVNPKAARTRKLLNDAADSIIYKARQESIVATGSANTEDSSAIQHRSLLQLLFDAHLDFDEKGQASSSSVNNTKNKLSDIELRGEVKTFILAGHETTSAWCYWAMYALAKYPVIQQKLYVHILSYSSSTTTTTKSKHSISSDDVESMEYLAAFMNEVLRLYSPVGLIFRYTTREETWQGYKIPKNTRGIIPIHLLNRHPDYFKDPDEFIPDRWLDKDECTARHKFCFIPFSAGGRNCVGQRFAEIEAKLMVANICRAFVITLAPCMNDKEIGFANFISMKSKPLIQIQVQQR
jgi:cytochrome P450